MNSFRGRVKAPYRRGRGRGCERSVGVDAGLVAPVPPVALETPALRTGYSYPILWRTGPQSQGRMPRRGSDRPPEPTGGPGGPQGRSRCDHIVHQHGSRRRACPQGEPWRAATRVGGSGAGRRPDSRSERGDHGKAGRRSQHMCQSTSRVDAMHVASCGYPGQRHQRRCIIRDQIAHGAPQQLSDSPHRLVLEPNDHRSRRAGVKKGTAHQDAPDEPLRCSPQSAKAWPAETTSRGSPAGDTSHAPHRRAAL